MTGKVALDQLVTIDFNALTSACLETVSDERMEELLLKVNVLFQRNQF